MPKHPLLNTTVQVEFHFDDVQVFKDARIIAYDDVLDTVLVRTDWGEAWLESAYLHIPRLVPAR
jgi:hypothetical protein